MISESSTQRATVSQDARGRVVTELSQDYKAERLLLQASEASNPVPVSQQALRGAFSADQLDSRHDRGFKVSGEAHAALGVLRWADGLRHD